jgi:ubiquinone/menaquinone biosynthesis C-methylase UbiE
MKKGQEMFFNEEVAKKFAEAENNEKNINVSIAIDSIILKFLDKISDKPLGVNLFGGAHADRHDKLIEKLNKKNGKLYWVDYSKIMLKLAKEYASKKNDQRMNVINFIEKDYLDYLNSVKNESIDFLFIIYSLDYIKNFNEFFKLLYKKMKKNSFLISTVTIPTNILPSHSTNAKYFFKNKEIPFGNNVKLKEGETFKIGFFKESGNPKSDLIEGAYTTKYYYSMDKTTQEAKKSGFNVFFDNIKELIEDNFNLNNKILFLWKGDIK